MTTHKWGGIAAITQALTYVFGFVLFFGILDRTGQVTPAENLEFVIQNRDIYFAGYIVIGVLFSFSLLVLVQSLYSRLKAASPELMRFTAAVGYLWAFIVLSSSMIFLTSLSALPRIFEQDPEQALIINRTISIVVNALGGGIELVGAVWVLAISFVGLKHRIFGAVLHYWGILVGISGTLTLLSGLSFLATHPFFEATTAIFGLGQILWFLGLGILMIRDRSH